jgi:hypothetical protein
MLFEARTTDYLLNPRVLRSAQSSVAANTPKATAIGVAAIMSIDIEQSPSVHRGETSSWQCSGPALIHIKTVSAGGGRTDLTWIKTQPDAAQIDPNYAFAFTDLRSANGRVSTQLCDAALDCVKARPP